MIVRCTGKALKLLGEGAVEHVQPGDDDWYLNLFWLDRRKCLLLVHATTLFPVFTADVRTAELRPLAPWVATRVRQALASEDLPADGLGALDSDAAVITKTASRRVLGIMNDMVTQIEYAASEAGGIAFLDAVAMNRSLRRGLYTHGPDYARPLEVTLERLAADRRQA